MSLNALAAGLNADELKACCAAGYSSDVVTLLLGSSYHPGGVKLTRRLLDLLRLQPGETVVDVASGIGTSSRLAAQEYGALVHGIDLSASNVKVARQAARTSQLADQLTFHHGDAEALPIPDRSCDAVFSECALCTFPNKRAAAAEMARILRPGGRVGIADITADRSRLPEELTGVAAWVACVADARPATEYSALLTDAGFTSVIVEHHAPAQERMIVEIGARLDLLAMADARRLQALGLDLDRADRVLDAAREAIRDGILDYVLITAEKP